jgi:hypothetical protein
VPNPLITRATLNVNSTNPGSSISSRNVVLGGWFGNVTKSPQTVLGVQQTLQRTFDQQNATQRTPQSSASKSTVSINALTSPIQRVQKDIFSFDDEDEMQYRGRYG